MKTYKSPLVQKLIEIALLEDIGLGDVTVASIVSKDSKSKAQIIARENLIVCGVDIVEEIRKIGQFDFKVNVNVSDGILVQSGKVLVELMGSSADILTAERTILNFLQRMSGVATQAKELALLASPLVVLDSRKTIPGWRVLDKYAVAVGGGKNHRLSLSDMVLIKNNHIDLYRGNMQKLFSICRDNKPFYTPVQVEVRTIAELKKILPLKPDSIMLDNMIDKLIIAAVKIVKNQKNYFPRIEASGGITKDRIKILKKVGIDAVSIGALTTKAINKDISMKLY